MKRLAVTVLAALLTLGSLALPMTAGATEKVRHFDSPQQRERYRELLSSLRCLVCQNESLASSQADLAEDLRDQVYRLIVTEGRSNQAAIDYLTQRYGEFVLYRPRFEPKTWLLWFGPLLMLLLGGAVLAVTIRRRRTTDDPQLSPEQHARAERLLEGETSDRDSHA